MEGVIGSIPIAPTNKNNNLQVSTPALMERVDKGLLSKWPDLARFLSKLHVADLDGCWIWTGGGDGSGYGQFTCAWRAHRYAHTVFNGPIPDGKVVRHWCDQALCCNPAHLSVGSPAENVADRVARNRSAVGEKNGRWKGGVSAMKPSRGPLPPRHPTGLSSDTTKDRTREGTCPKCFRPGLVRFSRTATGSRMWICDACAAIRNEWHKQRQGGAA